MENSKKIAELENKITKIDSKLDNMLSIMTKIDSKLSELSSKQLSRGRIYNNPLIASKALNDTIFAVKDYEEENKKGILAKELAQVRGLSQPTIYDHLSKLEEAEILFWQRGSELGLEPHNAKYYYIKERKKSLNEVTILSELPDMDAKVASLIRVNPSGISIEEITAELIPKSAKITVKAKKELIKEVEISLLSLMRQVLIRKQKTGNIENYIVFE